MLNHIITVSKYARTLIEFETIKLSAKCEPNLLQLGNTKPGFQSLTSLFRPPAQNVREMFVSLPEEAACLV